MRILLPRTPSARKRCATLLTVAALMLLYVLGVGIRRTIVQAQAPAPGKVLPFTLESALQFRLVRKVFTGEGIPRHDPDVQFPEGVRTFALDTTGPEFLMAHVARGFPPALTLAERVRWIHVLWFCLGIPLLALWIRTETGSWFGGLSAGLLYATAVSSVLRSTGQEISHENHALPLLVAHLFAEAWIAASTHRRGRIPGARDALGSGLPLALAIAAWDLIQVYTMIWSFFHLVAWLRKPEGFASGRVRYAAGVWTLLAAAGLFSPYLRSHGFLLSPTLLCGYGVLLGSAWISLKAKPDAPLPRGARWAVLLPWVLAVPMAAPYAESYGHFGELLWAKIRFMNNKPSDPALLSFAQRILWTPALHSATRRIAEFIFPAFRALTAAAVVVRLLPLALFARTDRVKESEVRIWFLFCVSLVLFVLFVRFHVFVALFGSAVVGIAIGSLARRSLWMAWAAVPLVLLGALVETGSLTEAPERAGRPRVQYDQLEELTAWLRTHADRQPVLANFGVSASVLAYAGCPILLHPKFETPAIRNRVEAYGRLLFGESEEELRSWAEAHGARYLVYALGEFAQSSPEYQMRYMVNALDPPAEAPARRFEFEPDALEGFRFIWGNVKYRVFRIRRADDEEEWLFRRGAAADALAEGRLSEAERHAEQALQIRPDDAESWRVIRHVLALRRAGFPDEARP